MQKVKSKGRDANSRGRHRYFYRGIRNHTRSRLILVGAPTTYVKGIPREGQAPWSSNSVESHRPFPRASDAPLSASSRTLPTVFTIELPIKTSWASFPPVHGGGRITNVVDTVLQDSRPTRYNYNGSCKSRGAMWVFINSLN
jgi:hypothetical protein